MNVKQTLARVAVFLLLLAPAAQAQTKADLPDEQAAARQAERLETSIAESDRAAGKTTAMPLSFRNFVRGGIMNGNLLSVPYVTNVNISGGYWGGTVSPSRITWPKGSGVEYGHTMSFIVAGEVINEVGDTLRIVSESYNRSGGDAHPSGSHKYFWNALPGFYNMQGDPSTTNQLNNNPDDRALLEATGFYFVGGLNEDANGNGELDPGEDLNGNGELDLELINDVEYTAQSNLHQTWPAFWPPGSYVGDDRQPGEARPGVRAGRWNGQFGSFVRGDQEAYYVADDRDNDDFPYYPFLDPPPASPTAATGPTAAGAGSGSKSRCATTSGPVCSPKTSSSARSTSRTSAARTSTGPSSR